MAVARFDFHGTLAPTEFDPHLSLAVSLDEGPPGHWLRLRRADDFLMGLVQGIASEITWPFITQLFSGEGPILVPALPS